MIPSNVKSYLYLWLVSKELFELARFCQLLLNLATREIIKHSSPGFYVTIVLNRYKNIILYNTRSIGTIRAPTSSWSPFRPLDFFPLEYTT